MGCQGLPLEVRLSQSLLLGGRDSGVAAAGWISAKGFQLAGRSMGAAGKELLKLLPGAPMAGGEEGVGRGQEYSSAFQGSPTQCVPST